MYHNEVPPPESQLAKSLQRGLFLRTYEHCEVIGRGGYGTVVKAWHKEEQRWYAVKCIRTKVRACETFEDNLKVWSGPKVFKQLCSLRSPNVMRYFQCWSELPEDLYEVEETKDLQKPMSRVQSCGFFPLTADVSDDGFEWEAPTEDTPENPGSNLSSVVSNVSDDPTRVKYTIMIMFQIEYCEGTDLSSWLVQPKEYKGLTSTSIAGVLEIFRQIMQGLCALHKVGIIHCDLKPGNLLITKLDAQVKFFDFGLARILSSNFNHQSSRMPLNPKLQEKSYTAIGTPGYAPPEHCTFGSPKHQCNTEFLPDDGDSVAGPAADIFSAGIILLELLMAHVKGGPAWFTSMERAAAFKQVRLGHGKALPIEVLQDPSIEGWLRQLVLRMVVWDPNGRPSAQEVLNELEVGLWATSRHNPNLGTQHHGLLQLAAISSPLCTAHNPYIGYFCDHRRKTAWMPKRSNSN